MANCCNQTRCSCGSGPTRYNGPNIDCIGLTAGTPYDEVVQLLAESLCDIPFEDGVGISEIIDNEDGTVTIVLTDGTTSVINISPNVELQQGSNITITSSTVENTTTYTISANQVCPMTVKIGGTTLAPRSIEAVVTGGTAPYTYTWEMADFSAGAGAIIESMILLNATAFPQVVRPDINLDYDNRLFDSNGLPNAARAGLAKVTVTDANGCIARDTLFIVFTPES
jgi:hypothetical protein